jgi:hypothetical protein
VYVPDRLAVGIAPVTVANSMQQRGMLIWYVCVLWVWWMVNELSTVFRCPSGVTLILCFSSLV